MFESLFEVTERVKKLDSANILVEVVRSEDDVQRFILELNKFDQIFSESINIEGDKLGTYSRYTENLNARTSFTYNGMTRRKTRGDNYFLFDSGRFFDSFRVKVNKDGFSIQANEIAEDGTNIILAFGDVIGLTDESKEKLSEYLKPYIIEVVRRTLLE